MHAYLDRALDEIRRLARSYERLLRGHPTPPEALRQTRAAFAQLMTTLTRPEVQQRLDAALPSARRELLRAHDQIVRTFVNNQHELVREEARSLRRLSLGRRHVQRMARVLIDVPPSSTDLGQTLGGADEIRALFEMLHAQVLARIARARRLPRIAKKRAKKELRATIWSLLFGGGAILANRCLPETFIFSFALGTAAIFQGSRHLLEDFA